MLTKALFPPVSCAIAPEALRIKPTQTKNTAISAKTRNARRTDDLQPATGIRRMGLSRMTSADTPQSRRFCKTPTGEVTTTANRFAAMVNSGGKIKCSVPVAIVVAIISLLLGGRY